VLTTPIEAILGNPVDAPRARAARGVFARAKPLASPLTVTGLNARLGRALERAAAKRGRLVLAAPAGPFGSFPPQTLRPGSAFGVGYASGDVAASAIGTVAYTDADRVWGFGHALDGVGARSLLLQDAYVFRVINNPFSFSEFSGTYKYAAAGHDIGTLTNDALDAVVGRVGGLPATVPVNVVATDLDSGATRTVTMNVADEASVDQPTGGSLPTLLAPLAVTQAAGTVLGGSPARLTGRACFAIRFKEAPDPVRFCNRYVSDTPDGLGNVVASAASGDLLAALALVDSFKAGEVHVTGIDADVQIARGQRQAYLRGVRLRRRGRAGKKVTATLALQHVRGRLERRSVRLRLPSDLRPGKRRVEFTGVDVDLRRRRPLRAVRVRLRARLRGRRPGPAKRAPAAPADRRPGTLRRPLRPPPEQRPGGLRSRRTLLPRPVAADLGQRAGDDPDREAEALRERRAQLGREQRVGQQRGRVGRRDEQALVAQHPDLRAELARAPEHEPDAALALPRLRRHRQQLGPRLAQARQVPAALERRAERDVAAGGEIVEHGSRMRCAEPRAVRARDQQRPAADPRDRGGEHVGGLRALLREGDDAGREQRAHLVDRAFDGDARRAGRGRRRPRRGAPDQQRLQRRAAVGADQRRELRLGGARRGCAREDQRRGATGRARRRSAHPSWNRYTTPVGASDASSTRGSASVNTRANVSVLAAISSSSRSTGVASACTPLA
jgi:hypothetical protein